MSEYGFNDGDLTKCGIVRESSAMTLTEFLLARIAEDAEMAQANLWLDWTAESDQIDARWWIASPGVGRLYSTGYVGNGDSQPAARHIARHDPARVLAECAAKRAIVALHAVIPRPDDASYCEEDEAPFPCPTLRALALPYAEHPDYDEAWRP